MELLCDENTLVRNVSGWAPAVDAAERGGEGDLSPPHTWGHPSLGRWDWGGWGGEALFILPSDYVRERPLALAPGLGEVIKNSKIAVKCGETKSEAKNLFFGSGNSDYAFFPLKQEAVRRQPLWGVGVLSHGFLVLADW